MMNAYNASGSEARALQDQVVRLLWGAALGLYRQRGSMLK
jgi:hypothetical protein